MKKLFDNIKLSQLQILCNVLVESDIHQESYIKSKYAESALWFEDTLAFLQELQVVGRSSDELIPSKKIPSNPNSLSDFKKQFLPILLSAKGEVAKQLKDFLVNFQLQPDKIYFTTTQSEKIKFSSVRNLLLELEFIQISPDKRSYFVKSEFSNHFIQYFRKRKVSPKTFKKQQEEKERIGLNAEKAIIDFEVRRLSEISFMPIEIEHVALTNVSDGYDIKSFENHLDTNAKRIDRYIEVKAVSVDDYNFFWSRNEIDVAKLFGRNYYLYLLPVISKNAFDLDKLIIISNPFSNVYSNQLEWQKKEESVSFSKIIESHEEKQFKY
jgi:Protein NO VEIN, C-terminal